MTPRPARSQTSRLTTRTNVAGVVSIIVVGVLLGLLLASIDNLRDASRRAAQSERALNSLLSVQALALDMETGLRGYVITQQMRFLSPYERTVPLIEPETGQLIGELAGDPMQVERAKALRDALRSYQADYAAPLIRLVARDPAAARTVAVTQEGKDRIDQMRSEGQTILDAAGAQEASRASSAQSSSQRAETLGFVVLALLVVTVLFRTVAIRRMIVTPLAILVRGVDRLEHGDLEARVPEAGPEEVEHLGRAINRLAGSLRDSREELEARNEELARIAEGSLVQLDALYEQTPVGLAFLDSDLCFLRINRALAEVNGLPAEAHIGHRPDELSPRLARDYMAMLEEVLETGEPVRQHERVIAGPPLRSWLIDVYPVRHGETIIGLGLVVLDNTERARVRSEREALLRAERRARRTSERGRRRAAFLAEASAVLDASLDLDERLAAFARLTVPEVADWCAVDLAEEGGAVRTVSVSHANRDEAARLLAARSQIPDADLRGPVARVMRSGDGELHETLDDAALCEWASNDRELRSLSALGVCSAIIVPLVARGRVLGAITFLGAGERHFGGEDFDEARELARRVALAVDTARLYHQRAETARVLQMSLLPEALPSIEAFQLAARFHPAGEGILVGGDFYDVFATGPRSWAIVVGDVCGKGTEAAALTALARYTLRALGPEQLAPAEALGRLNAALLRQRQDQRFVTVAYAALDVRGGRPRLRVACAGHPPPILVPARGEAYPLDATGTLLGVIPNIGLREAEAMLDEGDAVVLYSDGVTEADRPNLQSPAEIARQLGPADSAEALASALEDIALGPPTSLADDIAILALRFDPQAAGAGAVVARIGEPRAAGRGGSLRRVS